MCVLFLITRSAFLLTSSIKFRSVVRRDISSTRGSEAAPPIRRNDDKKTSVVAAKAKSKFVGVLSRRSICEEGLDCQTDCGGPDRSHFGAKFHQLLRVAASEKNLRICEEIVHAYHRHFSRYVRVARVGLVAIEASLGDATAQQLLLTEAIEQLLQFESHVTALLSRKSYSTPTFFSLQRELFRLTPFSFSTTIAKAGVDKTLTKHYTRALPSLAVRDKFIALLNNNSVVVVQGTYHCRE